MIVVVFLAFLVVFLLILGLAGHTILFRDLRDFGWTLAGPSLLLAGGGIGLAADAAFPLLLGLIVGGAAVLVTLLRTMRNNGVVLAAPMYILKLALVVVVLILVLLAFGAVPADERRLRLAPIPSLLAAAAMVLFINGPRVIARRQAREKVRRAQTWRRPARHRIPDGPR